MSLAAVHRCSNVRLKIHPGPNCLFREPPSPWYKAFVCVECVSVCMCCDYMHGRALSNACICVRNTLDATFSSPPSLFLSLGAATAAGSGTEPHSDPRLSSQTRARRRHLGHKFKDTVLCDNPIRLARSFGSVAGYVSVSSLIDKHK